MSGVGDDDLDRIESEFPTSRSDVEALVGEVRALQRRNRQLEDGIRAKAEWWDAKAPQSLAFEVTSDFRDLLLGREGRP